MGESSCNCNHRDYWSKPGLEIKGADYPTVSVTWTEDSITITKTYRREEIMEEVPKKITKLPVPMPEPVPPTPPAEPAKENNE